VPVREPVRRAGPGAVNVAATRHAAFVPDRATTLTRMSTPPSTPLAAARPPDSGEAAAVFGLGRVLGEPIVAARGEMGRIWRLKTTTGRWALKEVFRPGGDAAELARVDAAFQEAALGAGVPLPRPIVARDGRVLVEVGPADHRRSIRVYSWVDLRGRDAIVPIPEVAAILGRLHGLAIADMRPIDPWFREPVPAERWPELVDRAHTAGVSWAAALERLVPDLLAGTELAIRAFASAGSGGGPPDPAAATITCHLDYNPENVLLDTSGRTVVVDWENSGPELPEQELASAVAEFVADPADTADFLRAYADAGGPALLRDRSSFGMILTIQSALARTYAERALDPSFSDEDRARSAHWVADIAAQVFTIERIDRWLDAADRAGLLAAG
jgi:Ser/Thr protein kinase RdoA (MazF antagonist)